MIKLILSAIIVTSLTISIVLFFVNTPSDCEPSIPLSLNLTIVQTPQQTEPGWPSAIPNPLDNRIPLPDTPNLALGKLASAGTQVHTLFASNAVDGSVNTYWQSSRLPVMYTIDLENIYSIQTVAVALNPVWEMRSQVFEILVSEDGENFTIAVESSVHFFNPATANTVRIDFDPTPAQFVRLIFTANTAPSTNAAQAAEIMVFE